LLEFKNWSWISGLRWRGSSGRGRASVTRERSAFEHRPRRLRVRCANRARLGASTKAAPQAPEPRLPVCARGFRPDQRHPGVSQPVAQVREAARPSL
jgi:hypothetical protein